MRASMSRLPCSASRACSRVEFDAVGHAVGASGTGGPRYRCCGRISSRRYSQAGAVGGRVLVAGEAVGGPVDLHGVADEHVVLAVDDVGDGSGRVARDVVDGDGDVSAEGQGLAALEQHGRLHLARDDRGAPPSSAPPRPFGSSRYCWPHVHVLVDVRPPRAQQGRVGLVDHDLRAPAGELPQGVGAADVVDVPVGQQDPAHVLDPAPDGLERGDHALGGRGRDPGVDDGRLGRVDEEAVETEPAPRRDQGMNGRLPRHRSAPPFRNSPSPRRPGGTPGSRRSAGRNRGRRPRTG